MTNKPKLTIQSINGTINTNRFFIFGLFVAFIIRLLLAFLPGFKYDIDAWFAWAIRLNEINWTNFYSPDVWTNYTPGYLYILALLGWIRNIADLGSAQFYYLLKIPPILVDLILATLIYLLGSRHLNLRWGLILSCLYLFNPLVIFNSAVWGQVDGVLTLALVTSILLINSNRLVFSSVALAVSLMIKPQTISIMPIFLLYLIRFPTQRNFIRLILPALVTVLILTIPFFADPLAGPVFLIKQMSEDYAYNSLFAYNFWGVFGFWINDQTVFWGITWHHWSLLIFGLYWLWLAYLYLRLKLDLVSLATLSTLGFFFLPTRVHERYLYPTFVFLLLTIIYTKNYRLLIPYFLLSLLHFTNLYHVYVYYNELVPQQNLINLPPLMNLIQKQTSILSIINCLVAILTAIFIAYPRIASRISWKVKSTHA